MSDADRQHTIDTARAALLTTFPDAWAIYVYGSFARGDDSPSRDIDLAILLGPDEKISDLLAVLSDVSSRVHREIDLVDLRKVSDEQPMPGTDVH
jgi:predicted nucleotidyltransferase